MQDNEKSKDQGKPAAKGGRGSLGKINVAIIGVGNCASSLVQGVHFYRDADEKAFIPGLMHANLGPDSYGVIGQGSVDELIFGFGVESRKPLGLHNEPEPFDGGTIW